MQSLSQLPEQQFDRSPSARDWSNRLLTAQILMFDWVQNETIDQSVLQAMEIAFSMIIELEQPEPKQKENPGGIFNFNYSVFY